jgi:hypothetical protein
MRSAACSSSRHEVTQSEHRVMKQHARTSEAHDLLYALPFVTRIALYGAVAAKRLLVAQGALLDTTACVGRELLALSAQAVARRGVGARLAKEGNHLLDDALIAVTAVQ